MGFVISATTQKYKKSKLLHEEMLTVTLNCVILFLTKEVELCMKDKEIIEAAMAARGYSKTFLAKEKLGFATPSGVSERLRGKQSMRVDTFVKFLKAMDFEVVVRSKTSSKEEWRVDFG